MAKFWYKFVCGLFLYNRGEMIAREYKEGFLTEDYMGKEFVTAPWKLVSAGAVLGLLGLLAGGPSLQLGCEQIPEILKILVLDLKQGGRTLRWF